MATRRAIGKTTAGGLKYKPIFTPPPPPPLPKARPKLAPLLIGGSLLYISATYVSMLVFKSKNDTNDMVEGNGPESPKVTPKNFDTGGVWENVAKKYDKEIGWDEIVMGVGLLRRWIVGKAKGDILEVSTGTGRNFDYYKPDQITSVTFTDRHEPMLNEAKEKFESYKDKFHNAFFRTGNVEEKQPKKYDTIVDTFGLCSCGDPVEALVQLADQCKSEDSQILLLEHGRSHYDWLNRLLDNNVDKHVQQWGCWWNRDIMSLFEDDRVKEKLRVVESSRWHLGTTCCIIAKPITKAGKE